MSKKIQIGEQKKGPFGEKEDWWYVVVEDDGRKFVEHEWSHVDPYKGGGNEGTKKVAVDDFLASDASVGLKGAVRDALKSL